MDDAIWQLVVLLRLPAAWAAALILVLALAALAVTEYIRRVIAHLFSRHQWELEARLAARKALLEQALRICLRDRTSIQKQFDELGALRAPYLRLFEQEVASATDAEFLRLVAVARDEVMQPLRRFGVLLDEATKDKIMAHAVGQKWFVQGVARTGLEG